MKVSSLNCPNCGAPLVLKEGSNKCFCSNCGTPVLIDDGQVYVNVNINKTITERHIEEKVNKASEAWAKANEARSEYKMVKIMFSVLAIAIILVVVVGILSKWGML